MKQRMGAPRWTRRTMSAREQGAPEKTLTAANSEDATFQHRTGDNDLRGPLQAFSNVRLEP
jgi:hypothetical protein